MFWINATTCSFWKQFEYIAAWVMSCNQQALRKRKDSQCNRNWTNPHVVCQGKLGEMIGKQRPVTFLANPIISFFVDLFTNKQHSIP